jgi:hypothetical protein
MIWGLVRQWWHCLRHLHRPETSLTGEPGHFRTVGLDCECGEHFWFDPEHKVQYLAVRAAFKRLPSGD